MCIERGQLELCWLLGTQGAQTVDKIPLEMGHERDPVRHFCPRSATEGSQHLGLNDEK